MTKCTKHTGFTDKLIASLKPKPKESPKPYYRREGRGFAVRVLPSGLRTFFYIYTLDGKRQHHKLGHYPEMTLGDARIAYQDAYKAVSKGLQPAPQLTVSVPNDEPNTFNDFYELYIKNAESRLSPEWFCKIKACTKKDVLPYWKNTPIIDIGRRSVIQLLERVAGRSPGQTANVHKAIRGVFEYALDREHLEYNPAVRLTTAVPSLKKKSRSRVLSEDEIRKVWHSLTDISSHRALKLILLTAQRPGDVTGLHSNQIAGDVWTIPQEGAEKNVGLVYLTNTVKEIIGDGTGMILNVRVGTVSQEVARRLFCCSLSRWTPHDLRRTARTYMAKIGVIEAVAEAVLGHAKPGMVGVYNQYHYWEEKKEALIKWEAELLRIVG